MSARRVTPGVVDRNIDAAELLDGVGNDAIDVMEVPDIGLHRDAAALEGADGGGGVLGGFSVNIDRNDMRSGLGQRDGAGAADAAAGAGH